jgi:hypothetical protein
VHAVAEVQAVQPVLHGVTAVTPVTKYPALAVHVATVEAPVIVQPVRPAGAADELQATQLGVFPNPHSPVHAVTVTAVALVVVQAPAFVKPPEPETHDTQTPVEAQSAYAATHPVGVAVDPLIVQVAMFKLVAPHDEQAVPLIPYPAEQDVGVTVVPLIVHAVIQVVETAPHDEQMVPFMA